MFIKTVLKINDDLKPFLKEEIDRTNNEYNQHYAKLINDDPFNWQWRFKFENNYGASVVKHAGSYGFNHDLFEVAILAWDGEEYHIDYDTDITDDVIGYLTNDEVMDLLYKIKLLKGEDKNES